MTSWKTPTTKEIDQAVALLNQPAQKSSFFDNLKNPNWIGPLYERGFFKNAPPLKPNEKEGTVQVPIWPESKFLARVASEGDPKILSEIVRSIETDNTRVREDLIDIVIKLPIDFVVSLYPKVIKYVDDRFISLSLIPQKIAVLADRLSSEGKNKEALDAAQYLLRPVPEPRPEEMKKFGLHPDPKAKFEIWNYQEVLKKATSHLVKSDPLGALDFLANLLFTAIKISMAGEPDSMRDYLYISRRSVTEGTRFTTHELEGVVISEIASTASTIIDVSPDKFDEVLKILEAKNYNYFKKIVLYLLVKYPTLDPSRVAAYLLNRELFDSSWPDPEYEKLLSENFLKLDPKNQQVIMEWIETGPDLAAFIKSQKAWTGSEPNAAKVSAYKEVWQLTQLRVLKDSLTGDKKVEYERLAEKYPQDEDRRQEGVMYSLNESPKAKEELEKMSVDQILALLRDWKQTGDGFMGPTKEGLGLTLREVAKDKAVEFSEKFQGIEDIDSTYIYGILVGIEQGIVNDKKIDWQRVLEFLYGRFLVWREELPSSDRIKSFDDDVRKQAVSLINAGLRSSAIDIQHRKIVWNILEIALTDPHPTIADDDKYDDETMVAINSIRGEALHSVIEYALWVRRDFDKQPDPEKNKEMGFAEMPEVEAALTAHLDLKVEPTKALRSVYGRYLPWLYLLDSKWTSANIEVIFSHEEKAHGNAAWDAYVTLCAPYDNLLALLKTEYEYRLINARFSDDEKSQSLREPNERMAEHVAAYYWRGKLEIDDSLIKTLIETADIRLLSHALSFMGRIIYGEKETPPEVLKRFTDFWNEVFSKISKDPARDVALKGFSWWFASNKFESDWLLNNLENVIDIAKGISNEDFVIDALLILSAKFPERAVVILEKILNTASKPWIIHTSENEIMGILKNAYSSDSPITKEIAKKMVNNLAKKQHSKFLEILR